MRLAIPALCLALSGCAGLSTPYDPTPDIYDVTDAAQVTKDKTDCAQYSANYQRPFNVQGVVVSGATGTTSNLGLGASGSTFTILGPILGGVGGILTSVLQYVGLIDVDTPRAYQQCLNHRFNVDHAGNLVEPPL